MAAASGFSGDALLGSGVSQSMVNKVEPIKEEETYHRVVTAKISG
jgi:hypothetical protein